MYYYLCNYLFVLLFQLDAYKRPSFSTESINLSIILLLLFITKPLFEPGAHDPLFSRKRSGHSRCTPPSTR